MNGVTAMDARRRWLALTPAYLVIGVFMVIPLMIMVAISFMEQNVYGGVFRVFSTDAYTQFLFQRDFDGNLVFNPAYLIILGRSVLLAGAATLICVTVGFPVAWFIVRQPPRVRNILVFLITIPFWTNLLVRAYAWVIILGRGGVIDSPFRALGLLEPDGTLGLLYTNTAILIGLTYTYLPLMVLPIYASLEKLDFRLVEAASDLYADKWWTMRQVVLPLAAPGVIAGAILVFVPALGDFISPNLLGGAKRLTLGSLVQFQFATARNWPFGAAVAVILLVFVMASLALYVRLTRKAARAGEP
ncbi:spermidine/putrescine transport system permease protein [Tepidamorphus gemmatus]|uniref:Spermidine/putrescine transport system permease protein n=1 Tax=Tepidamorphus gemmatus TaxID=747076 RepID=A0A4R3LS23_9HYPH|nr:ABC transporter permease [Tepidamorphus gemmatus]TCT03131.1 spermidine/putrescine transport system permease protein [Tepidamorphus gemmatus]